MINGLPRIFFLIATGIAFVTALVLIGVLVPGGSVNASGCTGASGLDCLCNAGPGCPSGYEKSSLIRTSSDVFPFDGIGCSSTEESNVCLRSGANLCAQVAQFLNQNQSSCRTTCSSNTEVGTVEGTLCDGGKRCCLEAPAVSSGCLNLAGVTSACKGTVTVQDSDVTLSPYWRDMLNIETAGACSGGDTCTVARGSEFCKASAAKEGLAGNYACVAKSGDCEKDIAEKAGILQGKLCLAGQKCCVLKVGEAPAAKAPVGTPKTLPDPLGGANIHSIIGNVIRTFAGIAGSIALVMFVYGGIMMVTSGGAQEKVTNARKILINSTIGIVLIFAAYTFVAAIIDAILAE